MKKTIAIIIQVLIFVGAWYFISDQITNNTYVFGLIGSYDAIAENIKWILLSAAVLSVLNIWVWWPSRKVINTSETVKTAEDTKSAEAKTDPVVPKMD